MSKMILYSHGNRPGDEKTHSEIANMVGGNWGTVGYVPSTPDSLNFFADMKNHYLDLGFKEVRCFDIHSNFDENMLSELLSCAAIHLSAGDPIYFSSCLKRLGLSNHLVKYCEAGGVIVGNSGGSMQVTKSVCLYKLFNEGLEKTLSEYENLLALGLVDFEFLPHYNRHDESFISLVKRYTKETGITVYSCADGGAIVIDGGNLKFIGETYKFELGEKHRV